MSDPAWADLLAVANALQSDWIRIDRGILFVDGAPVQELAQAGGVFTMDCERVFVPWVGR